MNEKDNIQDNVNKKNSKNKIVIILLLLVIIGAIIFLGIKINSKKPTQNTTVVEDNNAHLAYRITDNSLGDFDLYFLQLENEKKNKIYSPLSIKYALEMLAEGANGDTKKQITDIVGEYSPIKYVNSNNMSFANGLFVKDTFKESIKEDYINTLISKYNAEVVYDSFNTPDKFNSWVSNKTFKLIDNLADDIKDEDFILVNALAIDMEWVNKIQEEYKDYRVNFPHEDYSKFLSSLNGQGYHALKFDGVDTERKSVEIGAVANKYDIINVIGSGTIRQTVSEKYQEWLNSEDYKYNSCNPGQDPDVNTFVDKYIEEISVGYKQISSSTDFYFHVDDDVKVFAKDLKEYDGTTLQYIGIMPKKANLDEFIKNSGADTIKNYINNLKGIKYDNFKDGVITEIYGYIPMFKFDYELDLIGDLNKMGVVNIFDANKADLSNLTTSKVAIDKATHKANIEFSNVGIKAAAATAMGGKGAGSCGFDYLFEVPVEKIDLTFDKPYLFLIRDKNSGEIWFTGTVYEPTKYEKPTW